MSKEPRHFAKNQPCGCVVCDCVDGDVHDPNCDGFDCDTDECCLKAEWNRKPGCEPALEVGHE